MGWKIKSNETRHSVFSGSASACYKSSQARKNLCVPYIYDCCQSKKARFLNREFRSDLCWWDTFLHQWNGLSLLRWSTGQQIPDATIQTDASGLWGCGAFFQGKWLQWQWSCDWASIGIMAKELTPIILSCAAWGNTLRRQRVLFQCDNKSMVASFQKGSCRDQQVMHLLRTLTFFTAYYDIELIAEHIPGVANTAADHLSRNNMLLFSCLHPQAQPLPTPLPSPLLVMLTLPWEDWTATSFRSQFSNILSKD